MKAKTNKGRKIWKALIALFSVFWIISAPNTATTYASNSLTPFDDMRTDMLNIAEFYASYQWYATETNLLQYYINNPYPNTYPSNRFQNIYPYDPNNDPGNVLFRQNNLLEPDSATQPKTFGGPGKWLNRGFMDDAPVDTPSWISTTQVNTGIPYAWGRSTVVRDLLLNLPMNGSIESDLGPFVKKIEAGYFAGNLDYSYIYGNS